MKSVLVTGGTGLLGRQVIPRLLAEGATVRAIARRPGPQRPGLTWIQGDLHAPETMPRAMEGADTVLHLATQPLKASADLDLAQRLLQSLPASDVRHLVYMSITGLERMQRAPYYREKLEIERLFGASGVPLTVQRSTQFHEFIAQLLQRLTVGPLALVPTGVTLQPVAVQAVAQALVQRTLGDPAGHAQELAGPDTLTLEHLARSWRGRRGGLLRLPLPVPLFRAWQEQAAVGHRAEVVGESWASWLTTTTRERAKAVLT
ncbi:epimerase [Deinococcus malanensis]|uniref:Epimerase n=1 Tax=Deinococcus malanensis TaxID=1706855 RepID=A0ABQ2F563_9DEIO|nr:NAD(P)H-binding protein [Deinococcus malanensis]GGK42911.1 epimerase [Deinococcus malanensis]